jgi:hypothetical protein
MDIPEPRWRVELKAAVGSFLVNRPGADHTKAWEAVNAYTEDHFDQLVQAIARGELYQARAILKKHYPGSLERQDQIDQAMRGFGDV